MHLFDSFYNDAAMNPGRTPNVFMTLNNITHCLWEGHYATSRKVAGSSSDEVDFFDLRNPSSRTMALGPTQHLTEMSTRNLPGR
jgi:hypothetical protein